MSLLMYRVIRQPHVFVLIDKGLATAFSAHRGDVSIISEFRVAWYIVVAKSLEMLSFSATSLCYK